MVQQITTFDTPQMLRRHAFNSLAPGKFELSFRYVVFKRISVTGGWGISCEIALIWMSLDFTDGQSTLDQVMAWWQAITWANVYPNICRHIVSLGNNELMSVNESRLLHIP